MSKYGVLLPIASLPGSQGIGDFGKCSKKFIKWLAKHHFSYWQILPLNPIGPGNSPYMSICSEAIDIRYISLDDLANELKWPKAKRTNSSDHIDYQKTYHEKIEYLKVVFDLFYKNYLLEIKAFENEHNWIKPYAVFSLLKEKYHDEPWNKWREEDIHFDFSKQLSETDEKEVIFYEWVQMIAYKQWDEVRKYAKKYQIQIIADCPFYVGLNSVDCWLHKDEFIFDEHYQPTLVSGCPPDAFSEDGQLWGTPIYNFKKMKENGYSFLINRLNNLSKTCDLLRLDHFRAFDTYCVIPATDENARRGEWRVGPRYDFFDTIYQLNPNISLIAEDLGEIFASVHELRDAYKLPGMYVVEFMVFDENLLSNENQIVYPGTHDNQTIKGWIDSLGDENKSNLMKKFNVKKHLDRAFAKYCWNLPSKITIFQLQDVLGYGDESRINSPGTTGSPNWEWKLKSMHQLCCVKNKPSK